MRPTGARLFALIGRLAGALLAVAVLVAGPVGAPMPAAAQGDCTVAAEKLALDVEEAVLLRLLNEYRAANNQVTLMQSETLRTEATWMSADMAAQERVPGRQQDSLGRYFLERFDDCGYKPGYAPTLSLAESVCCDGINATTAAAAFDAWKGSPNSNANLLRPAVRYAGVSRECAGSGRCYWTLALGSGPFGTTEAVPAPPPGAPGRGAPAQVPPAVSPASRAETTVREETTGEAG